jgi:hypothetical protein
MLKYLLRNSSYKWSIFNLEQQGSVARLERKICKAEPISVRHSDLLSLLPPPPHTHTHTHIYIYLFIYLLFLISILFHSAVTDIMFCFIFIPVVH